MSTNDVPGAVDSNCDELRCGCWGEHEDGSLIFVEGTEGGKVVYSLFDCEYDPPLEYRDAMPEAGFKKAFSWDPKKTTTPVTGKGKVPMERWCWHNRQPFDWDRIISKKVKDGPRFAAADHLKTAAQRVADSLKVRGARVDASRRHMVDTTIVGTIADKLRRAVEELRK